LLHDEAIIVMSANSSFKSKSFCPVAFSADDVVIGGGNWGFSKKIKKITGFPF